MAVLEGLMRLGGHVDESITDLSDMMQTLEQVLLDMKHAANVWYQTSDRVRDMLFQVGPFAAPETKLRDDDAILEAARVHRSWMVTRDSLLHLSRDKILNSRAGQLLETVHKIPYGSNREKPVPLSVSPMLQPQGTRDFIVQNFSGALGHVDQWLREFDDIMISESM